MAAILNIVLYSNDNFADDQRMKVLKRRDILSSMIIACMYNTYFEINNLHGDLSPALFQDTTCEVIKRRKVLD